MQSDDDIRNFRDEGIQAGRDFAFGTQDAVALRKLSNQRGCLDSIDQCEGDAAFVIARLIGTDCPTTYADVAECWAGLLGDEDDDRWHNLAFVRGFVLGALEFWDETLAPLAKTKTT